MISRLLNAAIGWTCAALMLLFSFGLGTAVLAATIEKVLA